MKKIIKVEIERVSKADRTSYVYPPEYDPKKINVIVYESQLTDKFKEIASRGNKNEFLVGLVEPEDLNSFLKSSKIIELSKTEAEKFVGDKDLQRSQEKVTDLNSVVLALAKFARNGVATPDVARIIDAQDVTPGINQTKTLQKVLDENTV